MDELPLLYIVLAYEPKSNSAWDVVYVSDNTPDDKISIMPKARINTLFLETLVAIIVYWQVRIYIKVSS